MNRLLVIIVICLITACSNKKQKNTEKNYYKGLEAYVNIKASSSGLSLSEYIRRAVFEKEITERFKEEHIEIYKMLLKYHNNFKSIGNMYRKRNPKLTETVYELANEIKSHLKRFQE